MKKQLYLFSLIVALSVFSMNAQERIVSLSSYPAASPGQRLTLVKSGNTMLELPFIDDFSTDNLHPSDALWLDQDVYINNQLAINQPTKGVATLDMIGPDGLISPLAKVASFQADKMSSAPINLFYPGDTSIYLSFFYQAGGLGDAPEPGDSLAVEFFAPSSEQWIRVWSKPGYASDQFTQAMIQITDSRFLQAGFMFRFINYASLADAYEPSLKVNADHWHIDYVYLNRNRHYQDTVMTDVSLIESPGSLLLDYHALPWEHFRAQGISLVKTIFPVHLRNLANQRFNFAPVFTVSDVWAGTTAYQSDLTPDEIKAFEELNYDATFNYGFSSTLTDSAYFRVSLTLNTEEEDWIPGNNTAVFDQWFLNYYAYDDNHPEAGYGLVGEGTRNGAIAVKYQNLLPGDSLAGISILFNNSFEEANRKYFRIGVWSDQGGQPGELIWSQEGAIHDPQTGLMQFEDFWLDTAQIVPSQYYIGIIQTTTDFLNIGFDRNNDNGNRQYYNINGTWKQSSQNGTLMIRPLFTGKSRKSNTDARISPNNTLDIKVFPNPTSDIINITYDDRHSQTRIMVFDTMGRIVYQNDSMSPRLSVKSWAPGIYRIIFTAEDQSRAIIPIMVAHE